MSEDTMVTVRFDSVTVTIRCPHKSVDTDTIHEVAYEAIQQGISQRIVPRWNNFDRDDGPIFEAFVETIDEPEIEDDERDERPEDFDVNLTWWKELNR